MDLVGINIKQSAEKIMPEVIALRRAIHAEPEVGLNLPKTAKKIKDFLAGLPLEIREGKSTTGIVAILRGTNSNGIGKGKTVLLRGDMDAIPLEEKTGLPFEAKNGIMHSCGHDLHVAMAAGAAKILCANRDKFSGTIVFMFQPGEEGYKGAKFMLDEPGLIPENINSAFGIHVYSSQIPNGIFASRSGPILASSDAFEVTVTGRGGHGAMPWLATDPLPATSQIVLALQSLVTRQINPISTPVVVTVGRISGGTTNNIIHKDTFLEGTIRTFSEEIRKKIHEEIIHICKNIAIANRCTAEVKIHPGYPVTINDDKMTNLVRQTVTKLFGAESYMERNPDSAAEDFSFVLQKIPGNFVLLGATPDGCDPSTAAANHSEKAIFNEKSMLRGVMLHCAVAFEMLVASSAKL